jgi:hypothetical protein
MERDHRTQARRATIAALAWACGLLGGCDENTQATAAEGSLHASDFFPPACVPGDSLNCSYSGGVWSGAYCCYYGGPRTCVFGDHLSCDYSGGRWAGASCCYDGYYSCVPGDNLNCSFSGGVWSGQSCCYPSAF